MRWGITISAAAICGALLFVLLQGFGRNPHAVPFGLENAPAPAFNLRALDSGQPVSLQQFRGRPVVINFWASWCGPCRQEHPVLEWGQQQFGGQVQFLGVVFEDTEENARRFLYDMGASFPQLIDPSGRTPVDYGVAGVPETYFIDSNGIIKGKHVGPIPPQELAARIQALGGGGASAPTARP
jgi:cytochrome c biogenesis protein CcmG/thiol:disulfide interchange protein DsbE